MGDLEAMYNDRLRFVVKHVGEFLLPYFPDYEPRLFSENYVVAAYITVQLMYGCFQHALGLHTTDVHGQRGGDRWCGISTVSMSPASW